MKTLQIQETITSHPPFIFNFFFLPICLAFNAFTNTTINHYPLYLDFTKSSPSKNIEMENFRYGLCFSRSFFVFFAIFFALNPNICVMADDGDPNAGATGGYGESCQTDLSSFLPPPYGNMSNMVCQPVWNTYVLRHSQTEEHVVTIILSTFYTTGWVGIAFSKDGLMVGSSAMVGWFTKLGHAKIHQYYLQGVKASQVIPNKGELPLTNIPSVVMLHKATIYMAFQLKFDYRLKNQPILLAFGSAYPEHKRLSAHDDKTTLVFDFSGGGGGGGGSTTVRPHDIFAQMKQSHGVLGIFGWGLILPLGAIAARYLRHKDRIWYYLHTVIQFVGFIIVVANVVVGDALYKSLHANLTAHKSIGIFALVLVILQVLAFFVRPDRDTKIRKYWNWYHNWFGRFALFFGAINIVYGIQIGGAGNDWKIGYGFLLGVTLIAAIVLEAFRVLRRSEKPTQPPGPSFQMNSI